MAKQMSPRRVPAEKAEYVRERLRETRLRLGIGLAEAARRIRTERRRLAEEAGDRRGVVQSLWPADVRRFEGSDPTRRPKPPIDYVEAAALAFDVDRAWLLAEDDPQLERKSTKELLNSPLPPHLEEDRERRRRISFVLRRAAGLPYTRDVIEDRPEFSSAHADLEALFWKAFGRRGLPFRELLRLAGELGRLVIAPGQLPREGFRDLDELAADEYQQFCRLQDAALSVLLRPRPEPTKYETELEQMLENRYVWSAVKWKGAVEDWSKNEAARVSPERGAGWEDILDTLADTSLSAKVDRKELSAGSRSGPDCG